MKSSISCASLFACLLRVVPWVPHGNDKCRKQQPCRVMSRVTKVANSMRRVNVCCGLRLILMPDTSIADLLILFVLIIGFSARFICT